MPRALLHGNEGYFTDSVSQRFSLVMPSEPLLRPRLAWLGLLLLLRDTSANNCVRGWCCRRPTRPDMASVCLQQVWAGE